MTTTAPSRYIPALVILLTSYLFHGTNGQDTKAAAAATRATSGKTTTSRRTLVRDQPLAGGFQHVENVNDQPMIQEAATFALEVLQDTSTSPYSFGAQANSVKVIDAWQQVVQGLNFQLTLEFLGENDEDCVGACSVQIYNQFGTLSITKWNKEITCEEAKELLEENEGDEN